MCETRLPHRWLRCLWLTQEYPYPPNAGGLIYSGCLAHAFAEAGADLTVLCGETCGAVEIPEGPPRLIRWRVVPGTPRRAFFSLFSTLPHVPYRRATPA